MGKDVKQYNFYPTTMEVELMSQRPLQVYMVVKSETTFTRGQFSLHTTHKPLHIGLMASECTDTLYGSQLNTFGTRYNLLGQ